MAGLLAATLSGLKIAFGGSFSPFAFTARTTVKLCLSPPQDKMGTVRFPVFLWLATRISSGFRPCSGCGWTPCRNAVWLSTRSDGIPLPCLPYRRSQSRLTSHGNSMATFPFRVPARVLGIITENLRYAERMLED